MRTTPLVTSDALAPSDPPLVTSPHTTTLPSLFRAAKAYCVEATDTTPEVNSVSTLKHDVQPPREESPQAVMAPVELRAATANGVKEIAVIPLAILPLTAAVFPPLFV
jgi:hypothetical protein